MKISYVEIHKADKLHLILDLTRGCTITSQHHTNVNLLPFKQIRPQLVIVTVLSQKGDSSHPVVLHISGWMKRRAVPDISSTRLDEVVRSYIHR